RPCARHASQGDPTGMGWVEEHGDRAAPPAVQAPMTASHEDSDGPTSQNDALTRLLCERMNTTPEEVRTMDGLRHARIDTQLGELVVVAEGPALTGVYFPGHWHLPEPDAFRGQVVGRNPV